MKLQLKRFHGTKDYTAGQIFIDGMLAFQTMEDEERHHKIYSKTAIPLGRYEVIINYSPRFKKNLPLLLNVPGFTGVRIHAGNTAKDTEGCILIGMDDNETDSWLGNSRKAMDKFMPMLEEALKADKVWIEIT